MKAFAYRKYLLFVLAVILAFNYVDRMALGLVLQNIKVDLRLSDTQLGLLSGIAFALFYSTLGVPIGRWADRGNRITIISVTAALWSVMVMLSGAARSFVQLLAIRVGVAVGEAGCLPPAYSLIADYFSRAERPRAVALYLMGGSFSQVIGYAFPGWLNEFYGWRVMFIILGLPGMALAALACFSLREPRRSAKAIDSRSEHTAAAPSDVPRLKEVFLFLLTNGTFRNLVLCLSVIYFFGYGIVQWQPAFFVRSYGLKTGVLGTWFALTYGLGGMLGVYTGGHLASRYAIHKERLQLRGVAIVFSGFGALSALVYVVHSYVLAFVFMALASVGGAIANGPVFAAIQTVVPQRMRAMAIAIVFMFANLIGMGLGPLAVGVLSDALRPIFGVDSLRYALLIMCPGYLWGGWYSWQASKTVMRDLRAAEDGPDSGEWADPRFSRN